MNILVILERRSKLFWVIAGLLLIAGVGCLDFLTGYEIAFSLFYLFPISLVTWFAGRRLGVLASIVSAIIWLIAEIASGNPYSHPAIYYWNSTIRFGFFITVTLLLAALRTALETQKNLAHGELNGCGQSAFLFGIVTIRDTPLSKI